MSEPSGHLLLKALAGTTTPDEHAQVMAWVAESPDHQKQWTDLQRLWNVKGREAFPDFDTAGEWSKLQAVLAADDSKTRPLAPSRSFLLQAAAVVALLIACTFMLYKMVSTTDNVVMESRDAMARFDLPDGSAVWLNKHSKLTYTSDANDSVRSAVLEGEAFFEVTPHARRPFVVKTPAAVVRVLGTSFNVRAYANERQNAVYVVTGVVSLSAAANDKSVVLTRGEQGILDNSTNLVFSRTGMDDNLVAWKNKRLVFDKTSLNAVAEALENYFGVTITVKSADLGKCRFTGSFEDPTLEEVMEAISLSLDLDIVQQNKAYIVDGKGC